MSKINNFKLPIVFHSNNKLPQTGDILLYCNNKIWSFLIKFGTYSNWSHVGIAVWLKIKNKYILYNFEATSANTINYTNAKNACVKLSLFRDTYKSAHSITYRRHLFNKNDIYLNKIRTIVEDNLHKHILSVNAP